MEIHVNDEAFPEAPSRALHEGVAAVLRHHGVVGEVSVTLVGDEEIVRLNREYLGKDRPTDVIAFSMGSDEEPFGDVYVCVDQAARQADELGVAWTEEIVRLAIHGTLHVLGHDHPDGPERLESPMFELQERLLRTVWPATA